MDAKEQVAVVFETIGNAAQMLRIIRPGDCAKSMRAQIDRSFYADPTLAQAYLATRDDAERKLRLLDAAATFVAQIEKISEEVFVAEEERKRKEAEKVT